MPSLCAKEGTITERPVRSSLALLLLTGSGMSVSTPRHLLCLAGAVILGTASGCLTRSDEPTRSRANGELGALRFSVLDRPWAVGAVVSLRITDGDVFTFESAFFSSTEDSLGIEEVVDVVCSNCSEAAPSRTLAESGFIYLTPLQPGRVSVEVRVRRSDGEIRRDILIREARAPARMSVGCARRGFQTCDANVFFPGPLAVQFVTELRDAEDELLRGIPIAMSTDDAVRLRGGNRDDPPIQVIHIDAERSGAASVTLSAGSLVWRFDMEVVSEEDIAGVELVLAQFGEGRLTTRSYTECIVSALADFPSRCGVSHEMRPLLRFALRDGGFAFGGAHRLESETPDLVEVEAFEDGLNLGLGQTSFELHARKEGLARLRVEANGRTFVLPLSVKRDPS